jgi:hypothetical protein
MSRRCRFLATAAAVGVLALAVVGLAQAPNPAEGPLPPRAIACEPAEDSLNVPPERQEITVTFDQPMKDQGWSWIILREHGAYPGAQAGTPRFNADRTACTLPVALQANTIYAIGINSFRHTGFQSAAGKPAVNHAFAFATKGDVKADELPPRVVASEPANGATDVDPGLREIKVTFNREMQRDKWSWVMQRACGVYPGYQGSPPPAFDETGKICSLPVRLSPNTVYALSINSFQHTGFRDLANHPALPYGLAFRTKP